MPESLIDRAALGTGKQRAFLQTVTKKLSVATIAKHCECSTRTVRAWREEKYLMPASAIKPLARAAGIPAPKYQSIDARTRLRNAGKAGGRAVIKKYGRVPGSEAYRQAQWEKWWEREGRLIKPNSLFTAQPAKKPRLSTALAEFIGIMMGDGSLSRYQATISLNRVTDRAYARYVMRLCESLFGFAPGSTDRPDITVFAITLSRVELVRYLHKLGLPIGDKMRQGLDMPEWIRENRAYSIACVRGLVDTDGCIFTHCYRVKGKEYAYKKLSFTTASPPLAKSVRTLFERLGLHPRIARGGRDVRLDSIDDMRRYFELVGTHNPKHLERFES